MLEGFKTNAPNEIQLLPVAKIAPSGNNVRLFIERESLVSLETRYDRWWNNGKINHSIVLPDPPVVRFHGWDKHFELLAGHRRLTAASHRGLFEMPVRSVEMTDEEAYRFIREANNYETLSTVEKAFAVAEMLRLGFTPDDVREVMGNIGVSRYATVGAVIDPDVFSDVEKRCDPSITLWHYALRNGRDHFRYCLQQWDLGLWDEDDCTKNFRRKGRVGGGETYESGARLVVDASGRVLRFRGTVDLDMLTEEEIEEQVIGPFLNDLRLFVNVGKEAGSFGTKRRIQYTPGE